MLHLILIRHAKSSWDMSGRPDHDRPLNARGRATAPLVGRWLAANGMVPEFGLVSTALRARETWALLGGVWGEIPATAAPELYAAEPEAILGAIRGAPPAVGTLALVGHNPGIGEAARLLLAEPPAEADFRKYPTAATTVVGFDRPAWSGVGWGGGALVAFVTPKAIAGGAA